MNGHRDSSTRNTGRPLSGRRTGAAVAASVAALAVGVAGFGAGDAAHAASTPGRGAEPAAAASLAGGTVTLLQSYESQSLDPQRLYIGRDIAYLGRLTYRSLVALPTSNDPAVANTPVPDLATTTGSHNAKATVWRFTLKKGVTWQDDKPVTCADLKYGISRSFATDVITGGPNYILSYLDIPVDKHGSPTYTGPYKSSVAGQRAFDRAVTCNNRTITYHFKKPWPDFALAVASLPAFDPYRRDQDEGDRSNYSVFSDGPYKLHGKVSSSGSYTLVRNPSWDSSTDPIRKAYPDEFRVRADVDPDTQYAALIADKEPNAISSSSVPTEDYSQITGSVAARAVKVASPFTAFLLPNFNSPTMQNPKVRRALALATDRKHWSQALGGPKASKPSDSIVDPQVPGYRRNPSFKNVPDGGATAKARAMLKSSGRKLPVAITFTYPGGTPEIDDAAAALKRAWDRAGFKVTLNSRPGDYYVAAQYPRLKTDVLYGGWGADWPSIDTVIPPILDSRINLSQSSNGQDYGNFASRAVNRAIDAAGRRTDLAKANTAWGKVDATLGKETAYIPLDITQFYFLRGSNVAGYTTPDSTFGYPDLATVSLTKP